MSKSFDVFFSLFPSSFVLGILREPLGSKFSSSAPPALSAGLTMAATQQVANNNCSESQSAGMRHTCPAH